MWGVAEVHRCRRITKRDAEIQPAAETVTCRPESAATTPRIQDRKVDFDSAPLVRKG